MVGEETGTLGNDGELTGRSRDSGVMGLLITILRTEGDGGAKELGGLCGW